MSDVGGKGTSGVLLARFDRWRKGLFHGWWMVLVGGLLNCISSGFYGTGFTVYFLPLSRDLGLSRAATSTVFGVERIEGGFWGLISGFLIDRWGARVMMVMGAAVAGRGAPAALLRATQKEASR